MRHINNWGRPHCWVWPPDAQSLSGKRAYETIRILNITFILLRLAHPSSHPSPPHPHPPPPNHYPYNPSHLPTLPHPLHLPRGGRGDGHGRRPPLQPAGRRRRASSRRRSTTRRAGRQQAPLLLSCRPIPFSSSIDPYGGEEGRREDPCRNQPDTLMQVTLRRRNQPDTLVQEPAGHFISASDFAMQEPAGHFNAGTSRTL